ncbi:MAG: aldehyde ferredoxin oxidoreductase family protein [Candidatus Aminicenantes bacterium]|nr:aldehyde ferredoxin oxidoreductase family protein [Candidatus Aminicenantes bacterium]
MHGWTGSILRVNLSTKSFRRESFDEEFAQTWVGGRGFAAKILYDEVPPGADPLGPDNKFVVALGPIAGIPAPNTGKAVVAAKSPLTGFYGDGNLGTRVSEHLRKAGYDALIVEGRADRPTILFIGDDRVEFLPADEIWGKGTYAANDYIYGKWGAGVGVLNIGQGGENLARYAVVRSLEGRAGGRPGMGAVMGSKLLKAIVVKGSRPIPQADPQAMKALGFGDLKKVGQIDKETGWSIQSTTGVLAWCNEVAGLPVRNFRKTHHPEAWKIDGERLNNARVATYGCPNCTMRCGITIHDREGRESELDYENIGLLGSNLEIFELDQVGSLNYLCDEYGLDTMSAGCVLSFYADAIERGAAAGDFKFGDAETAKKLLTMAAFRDGPLGNLLADGSLRMARAFGRGSEAYAMQVKGLEVAAYNCKFIPGQALAFGVAAIGAHHREAWIITFELKNTTRESYGPEKAAKVIELQRIRGGMFEFIVACRFPWIELGWGLDNYPKYFNATTGLNWGLEDMWRVADRVYGLIKLNYLREFPGASRNDDYPPAVWFDPTNADPDGPIAGRVLEKDKYDGLLQHYYDQRGYDRRGIPTRATLARLGLEKEASAAEKYGRLT